ncbi:RNA polymerase factor sigma-54 [Paragemmobacter ruber]|uniref:RNA polymerase sigma-54 factor n=1 Tax=Paragemmobacter ruber TaxID=1985673 RepID=A0ABW9Y398_9RHOB|nr:RNA polymerase factor sigma-54 [Rhodobacter ruber]NBE06882.1 RNA polymerase factor sigma-54 [Rhodobacter ruber]
MDAKPRIAVTTSQRLHLSLALQSSLRLLKADAAGLTRYLEEQAAENPALQLGPPPPGDWLPRWDSMFRGAEPPPDRAEAAPPSLLAHVIGWIDRQSLPPAEARIALALAEALEPSGWLGSPLPRIAKDIATPLAQVEAVLARLQTIEPAGLFARSLSECLRLQARAEGDPDPVLLGVIDHLDLVATGDIPRLARKFGVPEPAITRAIRAIRAMNPKPGAQFDHLAAPIREPDLIARRGDLGWTVALNRSALPSLSVTPGRGGGQGPARALLRLVEARNTTLLRVGQEILRRQEAALDHGPARLIPLTMAEVAAALDLHESTVSRVVSGTSVDTPRGTLWLRGLFSARRGGEEAPALSAAALRARLADLVAREDRRHPLTDEALARALSAEGAIIARRTAAKYREMQGIPAAHRRRQRG